MYSNTISTEYLILHFKGTIDFLNYDTLLCLKVVLILVNSTDPDEMQHYAAFYPSLRCFLKNSFRGFQYTNGLYDGIPLNVGR